MSPAHPRAIRATAQSTKPCLLWAGPAIHHHLFFVVLLSPPHSSPAAHTSPPTPAMPPLIVLSLPMTPPSPRPPPAPLLGLLILLISRRMALHGASLAARLLAAVGVSGGPDSMALCVLAAAWKKKAPHEEEEGSFAEAFVDGLLGGGVDHGLRPESADEARLVRDRVRGMGTVSSNHLQCKILFFLHVCIRAPAHTISRLYKFYVFVAGVECEIATCEWPDGRPKQGHVQEAARQVRYFIITSAVLSLLT